MWVEKEGAYGNAERRTHFWHQLVAAPGESRSDLWQVMEFSKRFKIEEVWPAELIANAVEDEEEMLEAVRHAIGADTLGYISLRGLVAASEQPASRLCTACFDGKYPIELPGETALGKNVIEHMLANAAREAGLGDLAADEVQVGR